MRQPDHAAPPTTRTEDGSDGRFWCINGGIVGGTAGACTCTCQVGWEGLSCETAKACTASDDQAKDGSDGVLYCSEQPRRHHRRNHQRVHVHMCPRMGGKRLSDCRRVHRHLWTQARMEATAVSIAENTAPSVASPTRARVHATLGGMEAAARPQRRAQPPPNRQRMEATASSTAQHNTAPSAEQPAIARVHAKAATGGAAVRLPARAAPLQT